MGLHIDRPKPGYGNSNDGNTARFFFGKAEVSSEITGIDLNIIRRFHVILQVLSSGYDIDFAKFRNYAVETANIFVTLYPWYYMPTTVHKILIHGPEVIEKCILPIGQLSEEASEARNKDIKKYREGFARKTSRIENLDDIFKMF